MPLQITCYPYSSTMKKRLLLFFLLLGLSYGVYAQTTYYVATDGSNTGNGTSWANAFSSLQKAIETSAFGDSIFVKKGRYLLETSISMKEGVKIYGSFVGRESYLASRIITPESTILDGQNKRRVIFNNGLTDAAVLDGFLITGGRADQGGGIYNREASPILNNLIIIGNTASGVGGAGGGGIYNVSSHPTLVNVIISGNTAIGGSFGGGGGLYNYYSSPSLTNVTISGNTAENNNDSKDFDFTEVSEDNYSVNGGGGMLNVNCYSTITNAVINGNRLKGNAAGGAILSFESRPILTNVTISGNKTGLVNFFYSEPEIRNSIVIGNGKFEINNRDNSGTVVSYSLVQGYEGQGGIGNLDGNTVNVEDVFVDSNFDFKSDTIGNYKLKATKDNPVIDKGSDTFYAVGNSPDLSTIFFDRAGFGRFDGTIDMGAYEYHFPIAYSVVIAGPYRVGETLAGSYKYSDINGDPEIGSSYQWYHAIDSAGSELKAIVGATEQSYVLKAADVGKYIAFEVTPSDGIEGESKRSTWGGAVNKGKDQVIIFGPLTSKTYGEEGFELRATASSGLAVSYVSSSPKVATISKGKLIIVGAGTTTITAFQGGNDQWNSAAQVNQKLIINKKTLTITADDKAKTYGAEDTALTYTVTGFAYGDSEAILNGALTRKSGENFGTYPIQLGTLDAGSNYMINFIEGNFTIGNKVLNVITDTHQLKKYGDIDPIFTYSVSGFINGDNKSILTGTLIRQKGEIVGSYPIQKGTLTANNGYIINFIGADFNIFSQELLVIADPGQSKTYGDIDPTFTYTAKGFQRGDDKSILSGALSREAGETVGTYPILLDTLSAGPNYNIVFIGADFLIISKDIDKDGVPDDLEERQGTDPNDPQDYLDTDDDEVPDYVEDREGTALVDPLDYLDSDRDGIPDYVQVRSIREFVPQTLSVTWGTPILGIPYPTEVVAVTSQDEFINMTVSWNLEGYDPMISGTAPYTGLISETEGLFNAYNRIPMLEITVRPKPAPEDVTLGNSEFIGNPETYFQEIGAFTVVDPLDDVHEFMLPEGEGDNGYFGIKSGILFWKSSDEAAGRTDFSIVVKVTDRAGNELVKPFTIHRLRTSLEDIELHNTFTPNGDGINETWGIPSLRYYSGVRIQVFDNGGQRLFYTKDADILWDGMYKGKNLPVGTYFYVIEVKETGEMRRGVLNLLRQ